MTRIGALSVPLSTFAPANELARTLRHTDVAALLAASQFADASLPDLLEEGLIGLVDSTPELALSGAPFLRWIHIEDEVRTWSRTLPAAAPEAEVESRTIGGVSLRFPGHDQHVGCHRGTQSRRPFPRFVGPPRSIAGSPTRTDPQGSHLFAYAILLGRRDDHGSAQRSPFRGGRSGAGAFRCR